MKILITIIVLTIIFACEPMKISDANGNQIMAKFVKDDYGNVYRLDVCKPNGRDCSCTCLFPVDTHEYKVKVFENKK